MAFPEDRIGFEVLNQRFISQPIFGGSAGAKDHQAQRKEKECPWKRIVMNLHEVKYQERSRKKTKLKGKWPQKNINPAVFQLSFPGRIIIYWVVQAKIFYFDHLSPDIVQQ